MKKKTTKATNLQNKVSRILKNAKSDREAMSRYLYNLSPTEIYQSFNIISKSPYFQRYIYLTEKCNPNIIYTSGAAPTTIDKNFSWCLALIEFHSKKLRTYNQLKQKIQLEIIKSNPSEAIRWLDEIDNLCGKSMWSYNLRTSCQSFFQLDEKPENDYFGKTQKNLLLQYITFYSGTYYNDPEIYFTATAAHKNEIDRSAHKDLIDFFKYKIFKIEIGDNINFDGVFEIEKSSSLIDIYELILYATEYAKVNNLDFENIFQTKIKHVFSALAKTNYTYLEAVRTAYGQFTSVSGFNHEYDILDTYTQGRYQDSFYKSLESQLLTIDFSITEILSKSLARTQIDTKENFHSSIIKMMKSLLTRDSGYASSLRHLSCLSNGKKGLEWFKQLGYFVEKESNNVSYEKMNNADIGISFYSPIQSPRKSILFENPDNYLKEISKKYQSESIYLITNDNIKEEKRFDKNRLKKYRLARLLKQERLHESEKILRDLINTSDPVYKIEALRAYSSILVRMEKFDLLVELVVEISLKNKLHFSIFDTYTILSEIERKDYRSAKIELPILYILHSQYVGEQFDSSLKFSFEIFLEKNNLKLPTELFGLENRFGEIKLHYFMKWVCTPEIMKLYLEFNTSREIEESRLKICNYLLSKSGSEDDLQFEIKNISKNLIIREAALQVENSRIYVDNTIFKGRNSPPYISLFERYLELSKKQENIPAEEPYFERLISLIKGNGDNARKFWKSLSIIFIPELKISPKNATFLSLAKLMRQEFTYGEKGINNYLSTRIRHGVLPTALRKSSICEGIYIAQSETDDSALSETLLRNNIKQPDSEEFITLAKEFSGNLEIEISNFNDVKLQIYSLENQLEKNKGTRGIFDYSISPIETYALQKELPPSPSYEDLVKVITDWLWNRTDYILDDVKRFIEIELSESLNLIFEDFFEKVKNSTISRMGKRSLANAISRAKGDISTDLNVIASWFEHIDASTDGELELNTPIEIARRSLDINIIVNEDFDYKISQRDISNWVDVFFILFENAISKSNLKKSDAKIELTISKNNLNEIVIDCINKTSRIESIVDKNDTLSFYRDAYGNEELTKDVIQSEGGTGFFKIWKIFERDLSLEHKIDFGFENEETFKVSILIKDNQ